MFDVGESVVYPGYGAGKVVDITTLSTLGSPKRYYLICLEDGTGTQVWVPVDRAEEKGVRLPLQRSRLEEVWNRLGAAPGELPSDHKERYAIIRDRLREGAATSVAEALRDLWHKDSYVRKLTSEGKRLYDHALSMLSTEVAIVQGTDHESAAEQITDQLREAHAGGSV